MKSVKHDLLKNIKSKKQIQKINFFYYFRLLCQSKDAFDELLTAPKRKSSGGTEATRKKKKSS